MFTRFRLIAHRPNHRSLVRATSCALETLESRRLLTVMTVNGTTAADTISLTVSGGAVSATVNGTTTTQSDFVVTSVVIDGSDGADAITIHSNGANAVTINCGNGNDTVDIAPTSQNLDNIDDSITVNGDANTDTVTLHDTSRNTARTFTFSNGNQVSWGAGPVVTVNTSETLAVNAGTAKDFFVYTAAPSLNVSLDGNTGSDLVNVSGSVGDNILYSPSAVSNDSGVIDHGTFNTTFTNCGSVYVHDVATANLISPNATDSFIVTNNATLGQLTGSSGGVAIPALQWSNIAGKVQIDLGSHDGSASATNSLTFNGTMAGTPVVEAGSGSVAGTTSTMTVNGAWTLDWISTRLPWNVVVNGAAADATFSGVQTLNRLELENGGTADFSGSGTTINEFAVTAGVGNLNMISGGGSNSGPFSIGANCTLNKMGGGIFGISGFQTNGAGSILNVQAGTCNLFGDAGSTSSRTLTINSSAVTGLFSTQHLAALNVASDTTTLFPNGNRVLVTNSFSSGSEGGALDLRDNDMILDYTGTTQLLAMRLALKNGYDGGVWDGLGINSTNARLDATHSTALGFAEASTILGAGGGTFDGQTVDNTAILIKYTYYGDATLSGGVDTIDFNLLATNFNKSSKIWSDGDSNYSQTVDTIDFNLLAANFSKTGLGPAPAAANASKPSTTLLDSQEDNLLLI
jgi:hypothetical protein